MAEKPTFIAATNTPVKFKFKDKEYEIKDLTLRDWGEFCEYYIFTPYRLAKKHGASNEELHSIFYECLEKKTINPQHPEIIRFAGTVEGFFKLFELSLLRAGYTKTAIAELLADEAQEELYMEIATPFYSLLGFIAGKKDDDNLENP